jgi:hypothetical protein
VALLVEELRYRSKYAGSIPDGVFEIIQWRNPSGRAVALKSSQLLAEMSISVRDFRKKLLNIKCVFWFSLEGLSKMFLILRRI